jgi:hypothetical protein
MNMRSRGSSRGEPKLGSDESVEAVHEQHPTPPSTMAVSIVGVSTACSKDALVSSAKAAREELSAE